MDAELAQIYPALRRLLRGGFVAMKSDDPRRDRRVVSTGSRPSGVTSFMSGWRNLPSCRARRTRPCLASRSSRAPGGRSHRAPRRVPRLVSSALKKTGPLSSAARRRRRALLEAELAWLDGELALLERRSKRSEKSALRRPWWRGWRWWRLEGAEVREARDELLPARRSKYTVSFSASPEPRSRDDAAPVLGVPHARAALEADAWVGASSHDGRKGAGHGARSRGKRRSACGVAAAGSAGEGPLLGFALVIGKERRFRASRAEERRGRWLVRSWRSSTAAGIASRTARAPGSSTRPHHPAKRV